MKIKTLIMLSTLLLFSGCATAPTDQESDSHTGLWIALGAAVVIGAVALSKSDGDSSQQCDSFIVVGPNGSDRVTRCK